MEGWVSIALTALLAFGASWVAMHTRLAAMRETLANAQERIKKSEDRLERLIEQTHTQMSGLQEAMAKVETILEQNFTRKQP